VGTYNEERINEHVEVHCRDRAAELKIVPGMPIDLKKYGSALRWQRQSSRIEETMDKWRTNEGAGGRVKRSVNDGDEVVVDVVEVVVIVVELVVIVVVVAAASIELFQILNDEGYGGRGQNDQGLNRYVEHTYTLDTDTSMQSIDVNVKQLTPGYRYIWTP
jgi:hypothetical protein